MGVADTPDLIQCACGMRSLSRGKSCSGGGEAPLQKLYEGMGRTGVGTGTWPHISGTGQKQTLQQARP